MSAKIGAVCPKCGKSYNQPPAISRGADRAGICPECGIREALESWYSNNETTDKGRECNEEIKRE